MQNQSRRTTRKTRQNQTVLLNPTQFDAMVTAMLPALQTMIRSAMSDTMTVKDFAATRGVSERLVWQWLDEGVLLKAPTKDFSNKEEAAKRKKPNPRKCKSMAR